MNTPAPLTQESTPRELVAAEVRAELARRKGLNSNTLPNYIGRSQRYWNERLNGNLAFDSDDLAQLSWLLQVPMSNFIPNVIADISPTTPMGPAPVVGGGSQLYGVGTGIKRTFGAKDQLSDYKAPDWLAPVTHLFSA